MRAFGERRKSHAMLAGMTTARELSRHLATLLRREHEAMADFLVALADFDRRRLYVELGHSSLFAFLHRELGLSKGAAFFRNTAARLVQSYPEIVEPLRDGRLCLTSLAHLAKVLTPENKAEMLPRFFQRSKSEARELVAELLPVAAPPRRAVVTAVQPAPVPNLAPTSPAPANTCNLPPTSGFPENLVGANSPADQRDLLSHREARFATKPAVVEPLTADLRRYHLTVSKRFLQKLEAARDALSHSKLGATPEQILEAGLDLILAADARRKAIVARPRKTPPPSTTDRVPAHVKRAVFLRDGGRCQFPLASGGVCGSRYRVQLGHIIARADGGPPTEDNLRCECETHNQHRADLDFGKPFMDRFRRRRERTG
jgi:hypothetical protein